MSEKKVYVLEYCDYDSVSGEGNTTEILDIYENKKDAIENMESEFERRKKAYIENWIPQHSDMLDVETFEEIKDLDENSSYNNCEFISDDVCLDGIELRVLEFNLL